MKGNFFGRSRRQSARMRAARDIRLVLVVIGLLSFLKMEGKNSQDLSPLYTVLSSLTFR